jgi:hypothetical protein
MESLCPLRFEEIGYFLRPQQVGSVLRNVGDRFPGHDAEIPLDQAMFDKDLSGETDAIGNDLRGFPRPLQGVK